MYPPPSVRGAAVSTKAGVSPLQRIRAAVMSTVPPSGPAQLTDWLSSSAPKVSRGQHRQALPQSSRQGAPKRMLGQTACTLRLKYKTLLSDSRIT